MLQIICAWCGEYLGEKHCAAPYLDDRTTHGVCPDCAVAVRVECARTTRPHPPHIDEVRMVEARALGCGMTNHNLAGLLNKYTLNAEAWAIATTVELEEITYTRWLEAHQEISGIVSAGRRRKHRNTHRQE